MSPSEPGNELGKSFTVLGPPGVELVVLDGRFRPIASGAERLVLDLQAALYVVRWVTPDGVREEFVNLGDPETPDHIGLPAGQERASRAALKSAAPKSAPTRSATIVVLEQGVREKASDAASSIRLFNGSAVAMRSNACDLQAARKEEGRNALTGLGWAVRVYPVNPGLFRLRYETVGGSQVDQVVPAFRARRTIVILRQVAGQTLVVENGKRRLVSRNGAAPERTVILSTPQSRKSPARALDIVLAESLLDGILLPSPVLTMRTVSLLKAVSADPLLKLYLAAGIQTALDNGVSPVIDRDLAQGGKASGGWVTPAAWRKTARELLKHMPTGDAAPSDVRILRRRLGGTDTPLSRAPMLARSLDWAATHNQPLAFPGEIRGIGRSEIAGPWYIRSAESSKTGSIAFAPAPDRKPAIGFAASLLMTLLALTLVGAALAFDWPAEYQLPTMAFSAISIGAALAAATMSLFWLRAAKTLYGDLSRRDLSWLSAAEALPFSDGLVQAIRDRAVHTAPPFARRPILFPDDANKGRFGGADTRDGFSLSASFRDEAPGWIEVKLEIVVEPDRRARNASRAHVFLHDAFGEPELAVPFIHGRATLTINAYGGFTVGVWIPDEGVELELDLAALPDAPQLIRNF